MICYQKTNGLAHDLRFVPEDYKPLSGEILMVGDELPALDSLSDADALAAQLAASDLAAKRGLALIALDDARLVAATADSTAPQAVKDYVAACSEQSQQLAVSASPIAPSSVTE